MNKEQLRQYVESFNEMTNIADEKYRAAENALFWLNSLNPSEYEIYKLARSQHII